MEDGNSFLIEENSFVVSEVLNERPPPKKQEGNRT